MSEGASHEALIRGEYRASFEELNERLAGTHLDRHVRFFNFGYLPLEGEEPVGPRLPRLFPNPDSAQLLFQLVGETALSGARVLEVGCGRAGNLALLRDRFEIGTAVGVDLAHRSLEFASRIVHPPGGFIQGDAEMLPIATGAADVVLNVESAGCYPRVERFFREVARVLVTGGVLLYADLVRSELAERYEEVLTDIGFDTIERRDITANVLAARGRRAERELLALGEPTDGPLGEWVGQSGSALHAALGDGGWTYQILRMTRSSRTPPSVDCFTESERERITASAAHWAEVLHLAPRTSP